MTVFAKDITYGLETTVKECQEFLNTNLPNYWSGELEIYGLVSPKQKDDIIVPEAWTGAGVENKEYTEVFVNDKVAASIGFIIQDRSLIPYREANVDVVFTIRIDRVYPNSTTRDKEKVLLEAEKLLERFGNIQQVEGIKEGILDVFSGFDTDRIKYMDMHQWYVFSLNVNLAYVDDSCQ
jgi:hypothetical protein